MKTICWKCKTVLTDEVGARLQPAVFTSKYQAPARTDEVTWALCTRCFAVLEGESTMKTYGVVVERSTVLRRTFTVEANNMAEARQKGLKAAYDYEWGGGEPEYEAKLIERIGEEKP